jgi:two-component system response regulator YesN
VAPGRGIMFKVLIIDDEPIIRKGLKNIVNWKQYECEVCGEASDGAEGRELIRKLLPDIVITDIKMPETDGLTMIRQIKEDIPGSKIIILTGYRDFDYVHEAIKIGAFDYILKPSKIEELTAIIGKAVRELKFQRERNEEINKLKKLFEQNIPILKEKLLYDIIHEINTNEDEISAKMELFGMRIKKFVLVMIENDGDEEEEKLISQYDRHLYQFGIINMFDEVFSENFSVTSIALNERDVAFVLQPVSDTEIYMEMINKKSAYLQEIIQNCFGFTVTMAVSNEGSGPMQLPLRLRECREALEHKFYLGSNSIIFYNDINTFFKYEDYSLLEKHQKVLMEGIKTGNERIVKAKLNDILIYTVNLKNSNKEYLKNFFWNTISSINSIRISIAAADNDKRAEVRDIGSLYSMIEKCDDIKLLNSVLEDIALSVASKVNNFNSKSVKLILRKAMDYLQAHYNEQVTLNEVADHAFVSTYYISRMFKKELGKNFVDYLNEIRIEKAKELLKDIRYKTYEVADMVGIPDAHYFSRLFKKYEGLTPTEYRATME